MKTILGSPYLLVSSALSVQEFSPTEVSVAGGTQKLRSVGPRDTYEESDSSPRDKCRGRINLVIWWLRLDSLPVEKCYVVRLPSDLIVDDVLLFSSPLPL